MSFFFSTAAGATDVGWAASGAGGLAVESESSTSVPFSFTGGFAGSLDVPGVLGTGSVGGAGTIGMVAGGLGGAGGAAMLTFTFLGVVTTVTPAGART